MTGMNMGVTLWAVAPAEKSGQFVLVDQAGERYRENGAIVRWCSDVAAQCEATQLSALMDKTTAPCHTSLAG
ncbi:hypothetical protein DL991_10280 [Amycolatopsis sp. WAC 01375]|nr:hypothetical protein DL991_10280 [Amycolatopsis sp. WAC 01375]